MKNYFYFSVLSILLLFDGCSGEDINESKSPDILIPATSEHFSFVLYDGLPESIIAPIIARLEENYGRIRDDLDLNSINKVTVKIWNDETHYLNDMQNDIGTRYPGSTGYVYSATEVRILNRGSPAQNVLHEFCHAASMAVNSRIGNNPRWLWEAVAIYESGEFKDPRTIGYLVSGNFPTISELNSDFNAGNYKIYDVGYLLSEYIIYSSGKNAFINLIKSNGNIQQSLGVTTEQFEEAWKRFVQNKYLK